MCHYGCYLDDVQLDREFELSEPTERTVIERTRVFDSKDAEIMYVRVE